MNKFIFIQEWTKGLRSSIYDFTTSIGWVCIVSIYVLYILYIMYNILYINIWIYNNYNNIFFKYVNKLVYIQSKKGLWSSIYDFIDIIKVDGV